jgi:hypothetical protein
VGNFIFMREGRTEEFAKLSTQIFSLMQNGKVVESLESLKEKVAFVIKPSYLNTTLSCKIEAMQENLTVTGQSDDSDAISELSKLRGQAIASADAKYFADRAAAYSKKAQSFAELAKVKDLALAKVKSSKEEVKIRIAYLKAFTAASNLWKKELADAAKSRAAAKALGKQFDVDTLEKSGISIYLLPKIYSPTIMGLAPVHSISSA